MFCNSQLVYGCVQGRFKQDVTVEDVVSGQEFKRQPKNLPAMWLVDKVLIRVSHFPLQRSLEQLNKQKPCTSWLFKGPSSLAGVRISILPAKHRAIKCSAALGLVLGQDFVLWGKDFYDADWILHACAQLAKKISPSMDIGPLSAPYLLAPVLALAQLVNVSRPGEEPDPSKPTPEDLRLFDPSLTNGSGEHLPFCGFAQFYSRVIRSKLRG